MRLTCCSFRTAIIMASFFVRGIDVINKSAVPTHSVAGQDGADA
jgi:hypothetical protein